MAAVSGSHISLVSSSPKKSEPSPSCFSLSSLQQDARLNQASGVQKSVLDLNSVLAKISQNANGTPAEAKKAEVKTARPQTSAKAGVTTAAADFTRSVLFSSEAQPVNDISEGDTLLFAVLG
jgi:hypothetical protein